MTLTLSGAPIVLGTFADLVAWTNSWEARDAVLYTPGATELANYDIDTSLRVASVPDNGTENFPLVRDPDNIYSTAFGHASQLPGPLWVPSDPDLFRSRPAVEFDVVDPTGGFGGGPMHSMLTPTGDFNDSADHFNPPNGYAAPYWVALFGDNVDASLGSSGAGPTIGHDFINGTKWNVGCFGDIGNPPGADPTSQIRSTLDYDETETVFILFYNSGDGYLTNTSWLEVNYRAANGALTPVRTIGAQNDYPYKELFMGWLDPSRFWTAMGIKLGTPTEAELAKVRQWAAMSLPIAGSRA